MFAPARVPTNLATECVALFYFRLDILPWDPAFGTVTIVLFANRCMVGVALQISDSPWQGFGLFFALGQNNAVQAKTKFSHIGIGLLVEHFEGIKVASCTPNDWHLITSNEALSKKEIDMVLTGSFCHAYFGSQVNR